MSALISPLSIAPMIDWTNTHFRVLMRLIAPNALLYTEMQTPGAIKNNPFRALAFDPREHPLALQLGSAEKKELLECVKIAQEKGFNEINLNLGCPSSKVQAGRFGACLMEEPEHVADCIGAMKALSSVPITVKTRIGIDHKDSYEFFANFIHHLVSAGCDKLIVHARKAWLRGLSPKQNRSIPPLNYDFVYKIKQEFPELPVIINGNVTTEEEVRQHMQFVDGVMFGRLAYQNPFALAPIHHYYFPNKEKVRPYQVLKHYLAYASEQFSQGVSLSLLIKPLYNFVHGIAGARQWKEKLMQAQQSKQLKQLEETLCFFGEIINRDLELLKSKGP